MRIINGNEAEDVLITTLLAGDVFIYCGYLYVKTSKIHENGRICCVGIGHTDGSYFAPESLVKPVSTLTYEV